MGMDLKDWCAAERGRSARLAEHFGISTAAVAQWQKNGVPLDRMKAVRDLTGGAVTLEEMVPASAETPGAAT